MSQIQQNLIILCNHAKKLGATNAKPLRSKDVIIDPRVRLKCTIPPCDDYGHNLMCPPNIMSIKEFEEIFSKYKWAILIQIEAPITKEMKNQIQKTKTVAELYTNTQFTDSYKKAFDPIRLKLHKIINQIEAQAYMLGYRFAVGFKAGPCKLCPQCIVDSNKKICRHPYQSRPSMEAVGIDVYKTAQKADLPFEIPAKNKAIWNGLVFVD